MSAEIFIDPSPFGGVVVQGDIEQGDYAKFLRELALAARDRERRFGPWEVTLNSRGGNVLEAIRIGKFVRKAMLRVKVNSNFVQTKSGKWVEMTREVPALIPVGGTRTPINDRFVRIEGAVDWIPDPTGRTRKEHTRSAVCYSACFLIWVAGVDKFALDGRLGIHRPRYEEAFYGNLSIRDAETAYAQLDSQVRDYLGEMGVPSFLIDRMFTIASDEMDLLSPDDAQIVTRLPSHIDEWLKAKCSDSLTPEESTDLANSSGSAGYLKYLHARDAKHGACRDSAISEAAKSARAALVAD